MRILCHGPHRAQCQTNDFWHRVLPLQNQLQNRERQRPNPDLNLNAGIPLLRPGISGSTRESKTSFRSDLMKAKVYVTLKPGVLDPQGKAIQHSVELLGFERISDVRQGKYFEISLDSALDDSQARESVDRMAREVLSNPIIEEYRVE